VQRTFIPQTLPERAGWELAATWQTARQVGGDFYDVVPLTNRSLGLFVADVADKGMPAALFMALTRTVFRAALSESNEPAAVLGRMNDLLFPDAAQGMFVTAAFAVLDTVSGRLTYANAGHNPPILLRANSSIERLGRTTMALGILDAPDVAERHIDLQHGDVLLMYTDGLTESQAPSGEFFGEPRLLDALRAERTAPATGLVEALHTNILDFTGGAGVTDDLTMLVVRRQ
jgi:sigma-B regulation protein RsbU (phosphoserine phosphatase)